jgi:pimeloyl-ACP methyl ester carboxylesterase
MNVTLRKTRLAALAGAAAALLALTGPAATAHASGQSASSRAASARTAASDPKPSIVLVHGAWADSSSWDAVVSRLQRDGYTVYVPPNPLLGLDYDSS